MRIFKFSSNCCNVNHYSVNHLTGDRLLITETACMYTVYIVFYWTTIHNPVTRY